MTKRKYDYSENRLCRICGKTPLRGHNISRICSKTPECKRGGVAWWRINNYSAKLLGQAKHRAKRSGIPFNLTPDTMPPMPVICPALGIPLVINLGKAGDNSPTIDRIIPHLGYVTGNVQWLSHKANAMKRDATQEELEAFAKWILKS